MRPDRTILLLFCALLALLAVLFLLLPQNSFSQTEKRALQTRPKFGFSKLFSGKFAAEMNDWYADQFPLREGLIALKSLFCVLSGQEQNNGVLLGAEGQLARWDIEGSESDRMDESHLRAACAGIRRTVENTDCKTLFLLPSRNLDIARSAFDYPDVSGDRLREILREELFGSAAWVDVEPILRAKYEGGEPVLFRTDHHWTVLGAYYAYCETMKAFGLEEEILPRETFREEMVSGGFSGSYRARGCMPWVAKEPISVWYGGDESSYSVTADGKPLDGFYAIPAEGEIGYELFLDGTHDVVTVEKAGEDRPKLVIFKDSFANVLAPFLARHFDLVLLNLSSPKQDFTNVSQTAKAYDADAVLVVYSIFNLLSADTAANLQ